MLQFLLKGFACYRLTRLITGYEEGPFAVLVKFRSAMGVYDLDEDGSPQTQLGKLFECPYCVGMWLALAFALLPSNRVTKVIITWLAISGLQAYLQDT